MAMNGKLVLVNGLVLFNIVKRLVGSSSPEAVHIVVEKEFSQGLMIFKLCGLILLPNGIQTKTGN